MAEPARAGEIVFRGIPVASGVCRGKLLVLGRPREVAVAEIHVPEDQVPHQIQRLEQALIETRHEIDEFQRRLGHDMRVKEAVIFDAHLLVLNDPMMLEEVVRAIREEKVTAEFAFSRAAERYLKALNALEDPYLRERASDIRDVATRVVNRLLGHRDDNDLKRLTEPCILVSYDLSPSQTAQLDRNMVLGFATDIGSQTSHTAIMARALRIPAVVGLHTISLEVKTGDYAVLDGYEGLVTVDPTEQTLYEYGQVVQRQASLEEKLQAVRDQPAVLLDGLRITLSANVESPEETDAVANSGAEGIGLFRTEFFFLNRPVLPDEEEQFQVYRRVAEAAKPHAVIIRTLDLGGDKFVSHLQMPTELNPFLGWRAIRFCLQQPDIFRAQLRAILRASIVGNVKMMYPMISCLEEVLEANALVREYKDELRREGIPFDENMEIGAMIEIPSAALAAESLARRVQFFSIGTNDLIQYAIAIDRSNDRVAHLYQPTHPSILRLIKMTVEAAHQHGLWAGVCGEMAGDPLMTALLLGLGVDELSVAPLNVLRIKYLLRRIRQAEARELAEFALSCDSSSEILARADAYTRRIAPTLFERPTRT
jgi:phosphotransferase system enzyme I (PtsI)